MNPRSKSNHIGTFNNHQFHVFENNFLIKVDLIVYRKYIDEISVLPTALAFISSGHSPQNTWQEMLISLKYDPSCNNRGATVASIVLARLM